MSSCSIIIPTHGRAMYLEQALDSCLQQQLPALEIIVVDDNGRGTEEQRQVEWLLTSDELSAVRYIVNDSNLGVAASRNRAAYEAQGDYLAFLDDDDVMEPNRIACQLAAMEDSHSDISLCEYTETDAALNAIRRIHQPDVNSALDFVTRKVFSQASTMMVRRQCFAHSGGFPEDLSFREDTCLVFRMLALGCSFGMVHQPLFKYRSHVEERLSKVVRSVEEESFVHRRFCEEQNRLLARVPTKVRKKVEFRREYKFFRWKARQGVGIQFAELADLAMLALSSGHCSKLASIISRYFESKIK